MRSTRDEKINSPRGLDVGGMGAMGIDELRLLGGGDGDGFRERREGGGGTGAGRGNKKENRLKGSRDCIGGWRTFRYMLKLRSARFAWGTYLERQWSVLCGKGGVRRTYRLAYPIFSEYIPLAKNNTRVVTETKSRPEAKYG